MVIETSSYSPQFPVISKDQSLQRTDAVKAIYTSAIDCVKSTKSKPSKEFSSYAEQLKKVGYIEQDEYWLLLENEIDPKQILILAVHRAFAKKNINSTVRDNLFLSIDNNDFLGALKTFSRHSQVTLKLLDYENIIVYFIQSEEDFKWLERIDRFLITGNISDVDFEKFENIIMKSNILVWVFYDLNIKKASLIDLLKNDEERSFFQLIGKENLTSFKQLDGYIDFILRFKRIIETRETQLLTKIEITNYLDRLDQFNKDGFIPEEEFNKMKSLKCRMEIERQLKKVEIMQKQELINCLKFNKEESFFKLLSLTDCTFEEYEKSIYVRCSLNSSYNPHEALTKIKTLSKEMKENNAVHINKKSDFDFNKNYVLKLIANQYFWLEAQTDDNLSDTLKQFEKIVKAEEIDIKLAKKYVNYLNLKFCNKDQILQECKKVPFLMQIAKLDRLVNRDTGLYVTKLANEQLEKWMDLKSSNAKYHQLHEPIMNEDVARLIFQLQPDQYDWIIEHKYHYLASAFNHQWYADSEGNILLPAADGTFVKIHNLSNKTVSYTPDGIKFEQDRTEPCLKIKKHRKTKDYRLEIAEYGNHGYVYLKDPNGFVYSYGIGSYTHEVNLITHQFKKYSPDYQDLHHNIIKSNKYKNADIKVVKIDLENKENFEKALDFCRNYKTDYNLLDANCTSFVRKLCNEMDIPIISQESVFLSFLFEKETKFRNFLVHHKWIHDLFVNIFITINTIINIGMIFFGALKKDEDVESPALFSNPFKIINPNTTLADSPLMLRAWIETVSEDLGARKVHTIEELKEYHRFFNVRRQKAETISDDTSVSSDQIAEYGKIVEQLKKNYFLTQIEYDSLIQNKHVKFHLQKVVHRLANEGQISKEVKKVLERSILNNEFLPALSTLTKLSFAVRFIELYWTILPRSIETEEDLNWLKRVKEFFNTGDISDQDYRRVCDIGPFSDQERSSLMIYNIRDWVSNTDIVDEATRGSLLQYLTDEQEFFKILSATELTFEKLHSLIRLPNPEIALKLDHVEYVAKNINNHDLIPFNQMSFDAKKNYILLEIEGRLYWKEFVYNEGVIMNNIRLIKQSGKMYSGLAIQYSNYLDAQFIYRGSRGLILDLAIGDFKKNLSQLK